MRVLDAKPVNLDGFSVTNPELGLVAMRSPYDPEPSLVVRGRVVVELDGKAAEDFDVIDEFIARYGLDLGAAQEAMALDDVALARMTVDVNVPRAEVVRLIGGTTPAKLARVVALLTPVEMQMAMSKMRARRTPSNQAHVTNQLDDPLLIAADAASAVAYGFREVETTVPVLSDAPSNAVALLIGSQVGIPGAMAQCSIEEALELRRPARPDQLRRDDLHLWHRAGFHRRRRHPVLQSDPRFRLCLPGPEDEGHQWWRSRGSDGCGREMLDPLPGVAVRVARSRVGVTRCAERRHRRRRRGLVGARRDEGAARREPHGHAA